MALNCAQFPLPIIAGIGHQRDVSILDLVAHQSVKTPTAVAELLIGMLQNAEQEVFGLLDQIASVIKRKMDAEKTHQQQIRQRIKHTLNKQILERNHQLDTQKQRLVSLVNLQIEKQRNRLSLLQKSIELHSPQFLLKYGYTMTTQHGKRLTSGKNLKHGDKITTYFHDSSVESEIQQRT